MERSELVQTIASALAALGLGHPARVGIDGRSAAGKTTFADELAGALRAQGRDVLRASIDDFHRRGHKFRSMRGEWSPRLYLDEGYDYLAFRECVLDPLGPGGSRRCRPALFDSLHDAPFPEEWRAVGEETIAVIDAGFLRHPAIAELWDVTMWLDIDVETMIERARRRDIAWVGSAEVVEERYRRHWVPTHELYEALTDPIARADIVIDNRTLEHPVLVRIGRRILTEEAF